MIKSKRIVSSIISLLLFAGIVPSYAIEKEEEINKNSIETYSTATGTTGVGDSTTIPGTIMPTITVGGNIAYCMDVKKDYPTNLTYTLSGNYDGNPKFQALAYYGYPNNSTGLMAKHGVSPAQARSFTQYAIYEITNPGYFANRSHPYLDAIRNAANSGIPGASMTVTPNNTSATVVGEVQRTGNISTSSSYSGTFSFPSDANVYSTDINGVKRNSFNIGSSFKIQATTSVSGPVTRNITVNLTQPTLIRYVASNSAYQDLGRPSTKTVTVSVPITINFPGVPKLGDVVVRKVDDGGNPLSGVDFGLYSDPAATNLISMKSTDSSGNITFTGLNIGTTYYVKEMKALPGYVVDNAVKSVTVGSSPVTITVTNTRINGRIKIVKTATGTSTKLQGAEFEILNSGGTVVDTITTGSNGEAISKVLPYGAYKVRESKAPSGYVLNNRVVDVNVSEKDKLYSVSYENSPIKGKIQVFKKDEETLEPLEGVRFGVYNASNNALVKTLTTGKDGKAITGDLLHGNYYVREIEAAPGYVSDSTKHPISITTNGTVYTVEVTNRKMKSGIQVVKKDKETTTPIRGVKFGVYDATNDKLIKEITTGNNGTAVTGELELGEYYIKELQAAPGYILDGTKHPVSLTEDSKTYIVEVTNLKIKGKVEIIKKDKETSAPIKGVKFGLYRTNDNSLIEELVTDDNGRAVSKDVVYGSYYVKELQAAPGYITDTARHSVSIRENGKVYTIEVTNQKVKGVIEIFKKDAETSTPIKGVKFGVYRASDDSLVQEVVTGDNGRVSTNSLPFNNYYVKEIQAATGYVTDGTKRPVSVTENGKVYLVEVTNRKIKGTIEVFKKDAEASTPIKGVKFGVYRTSNDSLVQEIITGDNGKVVTNDLEYGNYYIKEIQAATGYVTDGTKRPVSITENNKIYSVEVTNRKIKGKIEVLKKDAEDSTPLKGVKFGVYKASNDSLVQEIITGDNGRVVTNDLEYGNYYIKEIQAATGYVTDGTKRPVSITENGKVYLIEVTNQKIKGKIEIIKKDKEDSTPLKGVKFGVYKTSDNSLVQEIITGDDGKCVTKDLVYGNYYIKEIQALPNYVPDSTHRPISITENGKVYSIEVTNLKLRGKIKIVKKDAEDETPMKGVKFGIFKKSDSSLVEELITGEDGTVTSKELLYGEYYIQEIEAPEGYVYDDTKYDIFVAENERVYTKDVTNRKIKGKIEVIKKAFEKETPLQGVKFGIFTAVDDTIVEEIITDEEGKAITKDLTYGDYFIKELETIEGYVLGEEIYPISIKENEKVYVQEVFNKLIEGDLIFKKVDMDTKEVVAGATIEIKGIGDLNSDILVTFESTLEGDRMTLPYGPYEAVEISAPHNYVKSEEVLNFEIKENGQVVELELENVKKKGILNIIKRDKNSDKLLQGAIFGIYDKDKNLIAEGKTNEDGVVTFEGLVCDTYYYGEIAPPEGYKIDLNLYEFTLEENGQVIEKTAYNILLPPMPDTGDECPDKLPNTSGNNIIFMVMSLIMLSFGVIILLNSRRKTSN